MSKQPKKKKIKTSVPDADVWEGPEVLRQKEDLIQQQNSLALELVGKLKGSARDIRKLFEGFLEIADFMFKNTCGVGSNFQLAECEIDQINQSDIRRYYQYILILLAYHFGQLVPRLAEKVWKQVIELTDDPDLCLGFSKELEACVDHENNFFSAVQAGHKLWHYAQDIMHVKASSKDSTARIYYQTAPGQSLIYIVEQGAQEGWLQTN